MTLILAVEPDARQAAHIASVLRARPRTELVIADSAVVALQTLANRVPDVLLTSPLLSRQDETVLADWLRDLGAAAGHVQELTIPILATPAPAPAKKRGVLAALRRDRPRTSRPDGCEPDRFAEQISVYADLASAGRKFEPPPPVEPVVALPEPEPMPEAVRVGFAPALVESKEDVWVLIDLEELLPPPPKPAPPTNPQPPRKQAAPGNPAPRRRKPQAKPIQDEWGLFDPEQCGFAALLAKLDEITEHKNVHEQRAGTTVRLLSY